MRSSIFIFLIFLLLPVGGVYLLMSEQSSVSDVLSFQVTPTPENTLGPNALLKITPSLIPTSTVIAQTTKMSDELMIEDLKVGEGAEVKAGDTIKINYVGSLTDGTKFDSSYDRGQPLETKIGVGMVIPGWDQGVVGMRVGGKRRLSIPSRLAYGEQGVAGAIPPNATLIFEVELVEIIPAQEGENASF